MAERLANPVGSLSDGVERLDRLIRGVKDRQFSEALNAPAPKTVSNAFVMSPEEAWSKKFMTAGIGPNEFKPAQMPVVPVATSASSAALRPAPKTLEPAITAQAAPPRRAVETALEVRVAAAPKAPSKPGPIGQVLAKPDRRRSWFGRLVKGS